MDMDLVREYLTVCPVSPSGLIWKKTTSYRSKAGHIAGSIHKVRGLLSKGYWRTRVGGKLYLNHRIIYNLHNNVSIDNRIALDHIDQNSLNNNICNLRLDVNKFNQANMSKDRRNKSGYQGVHYDKSSNQWKAVCGFRGKNTNIGRFKTPELASIAYKKFHAQCFKEFSPYYEEYKAEVNTNTGEA